MDSVLNLLSSEALDAEVVSGVSYAFALIFFPPLAAGAAAFSLYCVFARASVMPAARVLSILWLVSLWLPVALRALLRVRRV